jgi:hypothetical protein
MLEVQSDQLAILRDQFVEQRKVNEKEAGVLELQARELQESLRQRRRAQAAQIFIEVEELPSNPSENAEPDDPELDEKPRHFAATVHNTSSQPVYFLELRWMVGPTPGVFEPVIPRLSPGMTKRYERALALETYERHALFFGDKGPELRFRDAAGVRWLARQDGRLGEVPEGQHQPIDW